MPKRPRGAGGERSGQPGHSNLRIIGGSLRGRHLAYSGDPRTRPMKERVREAVFNLLDNHDAITGKVAVDLFSGTGALGLEALSRGATSAILIERHFPTARQIEKNADELGLGERVEVVRGSAFVWAGQLRQTPLAPWLVFCSPPYEFYRTHQTEMRNLIKCLWDKSQDGSCFVIESDAPLDFEIPRANWDIRSYPPAEIVWGIKSIGVT